VTVANHSVIVPCCIGAATQPWEIPASLQTDSLMTDRALRVVVHCAGYPMDSLGGGKGGGGGLSDVHASVQA